MKILMLGSVKKESTPLKSTASSCLSCSIQLSRGISCHKTSEGQVSNDEL